MKNKFKRVTLISVIFVGIITGFVINSILTKWLYRDEINTPLIVNLTRNDGGDFVITAKNIASNQIQVRSNLSGFEGVIYLIHSDGSCGKFVTRNYWHKLTTGSASGELINLKPSELIVWSVKKNDLIDLSAVKSGYVDKDNVAQFCWLDAAVDSHSNMTVSSVVHYSKDIFQRFEVNDMDPRANHDMGTDNISEP